MRFLHRILAFVPQTSRSAHKPRSSIGHRAPIGLEPLEGRTLLSIPGVAFRFGNIAITATKAGGNVAQVSIDPSTHNVLVSFNGQSEEFNHASVYNVTYKGGSAGGDTFTNNTSLVSLDYGYGGNNKFTGGSSYNFVFFYGNTNSFSAPSGSINDVFEIGGTGDATQGPGTIYTYPNT
jgi:hypothetical protein